MKTSMFKICLSGLLTALFIILSAWAVNSAGQGGVSQTIKNATAPFDDEKSVDAVLLVTEKNILVKTRYRKGLFWTETRKDKVECFRCTQCHNNQVVKIPRAAEMAHGDILLVHGGRKKSLSCFTCHNRDERDFLVTEGDLKVNVDHSYQVCGQCHFRQEKDWVGGAHGKRVSNWAGKRVVKNCASCHDPHSPRFEKRWPKIYSRPSNR